MSLTRTIHNDPRRHPDPRNFDPTRYLHDRRSARESALCPDVTERDHFLFGAGRRRCAGMDIAENSLFLAISHILWAFNVSKAIGPDGTEITPDPGDIAGGLVITLTQFPLRILARSAKREGVIRAAWKAAQENLDQDGQWQHVPSDVSFPR